MIQFLKRLFVLDRYSPSGPWLSHFDEDGIWIKGTREKEKFRDPKRLFRIWIVTNNLGPFFEDVYWKFEHPEGDFYYPQSKDKDGKLLEIFQSLKGFHNKAVQEAMICTKKNEFLAWDRSSL